jgi:hypothetical protein
MGDCGTSSGKGKQVGVGKIALGGRGNATFTFSPPSPSYQTSGSRASFSGPRHCPASLRPAAYLAAIISGLPFAVAVLAVVLQLVIRRTGERYLHRDPSYSGWSALSLTTLSSLPFGWLLFWLCMSSFAI